MDVEAMLGAGGDTMARPNMTAARVKEFGGPDKIFLDQIPVPDPGKGEVLIKVLAAGVGPWDGWIRSGNSVLPQPLPLTLGSDLSGRIVAVGASPQGWRIGDEVYGVTNGQFTGAYAQFALAQCSRIALKPEALSYEQAATVPVIAVTAWQGLFEHGCLERDQTVLIHGGAGSVGAYAIQLAKHIGANVVTTVSTADIEHARDLGAQMVIDYSSENFVDKVRNVDLVLDLVGGETQERSFQVLKSGGTLVSAVSPPDQSLAVKQNIKALFFLVDVTSDRLAQIGSLIDDGSLTTRLGPIYTLNDVVEIHEILDGLHPRPKGKMVINVL